MGRSYIQRQTACLGYDADIHEAKYNSSGTKLEILIYNAGSNPIYRNDTIIRITDKIGRNWICYPEGFTGGITTGCTLRSFSEDPINPAKVARASIDVGDSNLQNNIVGGYVYLEIRGCGQISESAYIQLKS